MKLKHSLLVRFVKIAVFAVFIVASVNAQAAMKTTGVANINTATMTQLEMLPGIGASKAQSIMEQRQQKPFAKKEDLLLVKGIGEALLAKIAPHVAVQGENTIKEEKIAPLK